MWRLSVPELREIITERLTQTGLSVVVVDAGCLPWKFHPFIQLWCKHSDEFKFNLVDLTIVIENRFIDEKCVVR